MSYERSYPFIDCSIIAYNTIIQLLIVKIRLLLLPFKSVMPSLSYIISIIYECHITDVIHQEIICYIQ